MRVNVFGAVRAVEALRSHRPCMPPFCCAPLYFYRYGCGNKLAT